LTTINHPFLTKNALPVMEHFYTIQGEGYHQGRAAYFIRLGGCDVGCVWCDVKESWDANQHAHKSIDELLTEVKSTPAEIIIITGGEPLMYDCTALTKLLQDQGYKTHLETSGAYPLSGTWDWICVSPKKFKAPQEDVLLKAHELKVVVFHPSDLDWAVRHATLVNDECRLYLQPEWSKEKAMLPLITQHIQQDPRWQLSLQVHKYIGVR
jgi:organic radical activating enzyme